MIPERFFAIFLLAVAVINPLIVLWARQSAGMIAVAGSLGIFFFAVWLDSTSWAYLPSVIASCAFVVLRGRSAWRDREVLRKEIVALKEALEQEGEERRRLKEEIAERSQEESRLLQIYGLAKGMASSLSWEDMAPKITEAVTKTLGTGELIIYIFLDNGRVEKRLQRGRWKSGSLEEPSAENFHHEIKVDSRSDETILKLPIWWQEKPLAELRVRWETKKAPSREKILAAQELQEQLVIGLEKARLFEEVDRLSRVDGLTGLLRRNAFMEKLNEEMERAQLFNYSFCIMLIDVDHFKSVNDTYGHPAGDAVLERLGQVLRDSVYETDVVGRYGGEEFIIMFPRAEVEGVKRKAESLRQKISKERVPTGLAELSFTISAGLAHFGRDGMDPHTIIGAADKALYAAKSWGRNRIVDYRDLGS